MGFNDDEAAGRKHAAKNAVQEWAIQDEDSGEWYLAKVAGGWAVAPSREALATGSYGGCARMPPFDTSYPQYRDSARIVPAPPREMTDAECEAWLRAQNKTITIAHTVSGFHLQQGVLDDRFLGSGDVWYGPTAGGLFAAIRAARKKLEEK